MKVDALIVPAFKKSVFLNKNIRIGENFKNMVLDKASNTIQNFVFLIKKIGNEDAEKTVFSIDEVCSLLYELILCVSHDEVHEMLDINGFQTAIYVRLDGIAKVKVVKVWFTRKCEWNIEIEEGEGESWIKRF